MESSVVCPKCGVPACGKHCLAEKKQPPYGPCVKTSGWGTDHKGFGNCNNHGGATTTGRKHAKTLRQEAWDRILGLTDPALSRLAQLIDGAESDTVRLAAARDVLDRAGLGAKHVHEHTGPDGGPIPVEVRAAALAERARKLRPPAPATRKKASPAPTKGTGTDRRGSKPEADVTPPVDSAESP